MHKIYILIDFITHYNSRFVCAYKVFDLIESAHWWDYNGPIIENSNWDLSRKIPVIWLGSIGYTFFCYNLYTLDSFGYFGFYFGFGVSGFGIGTLFLILYNLSVSSFSIICFKLSAALDFDLVYFIFIYIC